jgi:prephenate dehydrogenase
LEIEKDEASIFNMAGSGFESTVRLAKSSPQMWAPIFKQNKKHISKALGAYIDNLAVFKRCIDEGREEDLLVMMQNANEIRRVLDGISEKAKSKQMV